MGPHADYNGMRLGRDDRARRCVLDTAERETKLQAGNLKVEIHPSREAAGRAAASAAADRIRQLVASLPAGRRGGAGAVIFATGASQLATLHALTGISEVPWERVTGFHMDEYVGISAGHPASFRRYLRENLTTRVRLHEFFEIDGSAEDAPDVAARYANLLRAHSPELCLMGIGENGHLAFNDPAEANFWDPLDAKVVNLDETCRAQQVAEGWFPDLAAVPRQAVTLTIPALLRVPKLIVSVPGKRKAEIVVRALRDPISTACPATILRAHADATLYLDAESAALIR